MYAFTLRSMRRVTSAPACARRRSTCAASRRTRRCQRAWCRAPLRRSGTDADSCAQQLPSAMRAILCAAAQRTCRGARHSPQTRSRQPPAACRAARRACPTRSARTAWSRRRRRRHPRTQEPPASTASAPPRWGCPACPGRAPLLSILCVRRDTEHALTDVRRTVLGSNLAHAFAQVAVCSFARAQQIAPACRPQVQQRHEHIKERGHAGAARVRLVHSSDLGGERRVSLTQRARVRVHAPATPRAGAMRPRRRRQAP